MTVFTNRSKHLLIFLLVTLLTAVLATPSTTTATTTKKKEVPSSSPISHTRSLESRYQTNSKYNSYQNYHGRDQDETHGNRTSETRIARGLLYSSLFLFVLALAFPALTIGLCTMCCGLRMNSDTDESIEDQPTGDQPDYDNKAFTAYQFC